MDEYEINVFEYAYRRYLDPRYLPLLAKIKKTITVTVHSGPASVLYDLDLSQKSQIPANESMNFTVSGYGMLRMSGNDGVNPIMLTLEYGPACSHGHPDKLSIDFFGLNDVIMPDPGVIFPYSDPLDTSWYWTTLAHCALVVDEKSQPYFHPGQHDVSEGQEMSRQTIFGAASTLGIERAGMGDSFTGAAEDRAVFVTPQYYADLFGAFSKMPHKYDLAWHMRGEIQAALKFEPMKFQEPVPNGYNALSNVRHAAPTDKAWSATATRDGRTVRFLAAGEAAPTEIIAGDGHYWFNDAGGHRVLENVPTFIERRTQNSTLYGNAMDVSGMQDGYLKSITQEGGMESGHGLLKLETSRGVDLCFAAYSPGKHEADGLETDAQQAFVLMDGQNVRAMFLGGGTRLQTGGAMIARSEPGLAYVEKLADGTYVVGNPSPSKATITVTLPALGGTKTLELDPNGKWTSGTAATAH